jgi:hypothetical protein
MVKFKPAETSSGHWEAMMAAPQAGDAAAYRTLLAELATGRTSLPRPKLPAGIGDKPAEELGIGEN